VNRSISLDDVIEMFSLEADQSAETLRRYLASHPEHAQGLLDFVLEVGLGETYERSGETEASLKDERQAYERLIAEASGVGPLANPLADISLAEIEHKTSIPLKVLVCFKKAAVMMNTVPAVVMRKLSVALGVAIEDLRLSLCIPAPQPGLQHKAANAPKAVDPMPFDHIIDDSMLTDDQKSAMLAE
jgi:hypothetical protein